MKYALPISLMALALAACGQQAQSPASTQADAPASEIAAATPAAQGPADVVVEDAWCRPTPNGAKAGGCYVILTSSVDDTFTAVATEQADMAQVHEMKMEGGVMKMAHLDNGLPMIAGQRTELKPHGNHIMLIGLKAPLVAGQNVKIDLTFANAGTRSVDFAIRTPPVVGGEE